MADEAIGTSTIDRILELAPAKLLEVDGFAYIDKDKTVKLCQPPTPKELRVSTLSGLAALIDEGFESYPKDGVVLHVESFDTVNLIRKQSDKYGRRQTYLTALALKPEREFKFNEYLTQETFNIALRSMFVQNAELDSLVALAGNLAAKAELRQEDDGFSQNVTTKAGVHLVDQVTVRPRVTLQPFRTFTEVEQPAGVFIFRIKTHEAHGNQCALFEADAGAWKNRAMDTIAQWLRNRLKGSTVAGVSDIPVVS